MNLDIITRKDWEGLFKKHPGLEGDLAGLSNSRELMQLKHDLTLKKFLDTRRIAWVENRIKELEAAGVKEL